MRKAIPELRLSDYSRIALPVVISVAGLLSTLLIAHYLQNETIPLWVISKNKDVNFTFTMQLMVLPVSFAALIIMRLHNRTGFKTFFRIKPIQNQQTEWKFLGPILSVVFTLGTVFYMSAGVASQHGMINKSFFKLLPFVLLFAATNSWSEEIFSRFVIAAGLYGKIKPIGICWISAILFGLGHFWGTPNGIFGVITSGFLGWMLAKSVIETKGLGWALFIHFLQDVVIFGAGAMVIAGQH